MNTPRPSATALATEVVAQRAQCTDTTDVGTSVMTKLHAALEKLIGTNGFDVVLARGLILAQKDERTLAGVVAEPGGLLKGLVDAPADRERGLIAVVAHLAELLMRFIGEDLATRIVRDACSHASCVSVAKEKNE